MLPGSPHAALQCDMILRMHKVLKIAKYTVPTFVKGMPRTFLIVIDLTQNKMICLVCLIVPEENAKGVPAIVAEDQ